MNKDKKAAALQNLRQDYRKGELLEAHVQDDPFAQFDQWWEEVKQTPLKEPNAMAIASVDETGQPSVRMVLLKGVSAEQGFVFYTNYNSRKAQELLAKPKASLLFYWDTLERQIRIEGEVVKAPAAVSDAYFNKRPKGSRLGAWASPQSETIPSRYILEENLKSLEEKYAETNEVPRPPHWGGFLLQPTRFEFWQGRSSRLHDRLVYKKSDNNTAEAKQWELTRLAP